jgi:hypothetical protein
VDVTRPSIAAMAIGPRKLVAAEASEIGRMPATIAIV